VVVVLDNLTNELSDNAELFEMSKEDDDEAGLLTIEGEAAKLGEIVEKLEFRRMFNNPADPLNCFLDIQAGAGGTEACDWASMLLRQYLRYAERKDFKTTLEDETAGDTAWCAKARSTAPVAATPALPACSCTPKLTIPSRSTSTRQTCAPTPSAPRARVASTSTRPTLPCA
jgi:hypothetical protein